MNGQTLQDWLVHNLTVGPTSLLHPDIDGLYTDDGIMRSQKGMPPFGDMESDVVSNIGLSAGDMGQLRAAWVRNIAAIEKATLKAGKFLVQMFTDGNRIVPKGASKCRSYFAAACKSGSMQHAGPLLWAVPHVSDGPGGKPLDPPEGIAPDFLEYLAGFLLVRGRYAYFTPADMGWYGC